MTEIDGLRDYYLKLSFFGRLFFSSRLVQLLNEPETNILRLFPLINTSALRTLAFLDQTFCFFKEPKIRIYSLLHTYGLFDHDHAQSYIDGITQLVGQDGMTYVAVQLEALKNKGLLSGRVGQAILHCTLTHENPALVLRVCHFGLFEEGHSRVHFSLINEQKNITRAMNMLIALYLCGALSSSALHWAYGITIYNYESVQDALHMLNASGILTDMFSEAEFEKIYLHKHPEALMKLFALLMDYTAEKEATVKLYFNEILSIKKLSIVPIIFQVLIDSSIIHRNDKLRVKSLMPYLHVLSHERLVSAWLLQSKHRMSYQQWTNLMNYAEKYVHIIKMNDMQQQDVLLSSMEHEILRYRQGLSYASVSDSSVAYEESRSYDFDRALANAMEESGHGMRSIALDEGSYSKNKFPSFFNKKQQQVYPEDPSSMPAENNMPT